MEEINEDELYGAYRRSRAAANSISRMRVEYDDLARKRERLQAFIGTDGFKNMDSVDQYLLLHQYTSMGDYLSILKMRIERAEAKHREQSGL